MRIDISDLSFGYRDEPVLHEINLVLDHSGLTCIVGPNGVGKSTLVKCILGLVKFDKGTILLDGSDVNDLTTKDRAKIMGYVPVSTDDTFAMNVYDYVMMGRHPHQKMGHSTSLDSLIVKRSMNMMEILDLSMKDTTELSAGQHQKVSIAKGLAQTPRLLILDEPTANLDPHHQLQVTERISDIGRKIGMSVIMVSHDLNISAKYADTIVMMAMPGRIYRVGTPEEVFTEEAISEVYGVECTIIDDRGRPHVILERALDEDETRFTRAHG